MIGLTRSAWKCKFSTCWFNMIREMHRQMWKAIQCIYKLTRVLFYHYWGVNARSTTATRRDTLAMIYEQKGKTNKPLAQSLFLSLPGLTSVPSTVLRSLTREEDLSLINEASVCSRGQTNDSIIDKSIFDVRPIKKVTNDDRKQSQLNNAYSLNGDMRTSILEWPEKKATRKMEDGEYSQTSTIDMLRREKTNIIQLDESCSPICLDRR